MFVKQATLPWIPGQSARRRISPRRRGMGDQELTFSFLSPAPGASASLPCVPAGFVGPLAENQNYCAAASAAGTDNWDSKTSQPVAEVCFQGLFPWVGQRTADGSCKPVIDVKSPWPMIITAGLGAFLGFKLLGGRH